MLGPPAQAQRCRIAVVGCGRAGAELHLPALASLPEAEIVALGEQDREQREIVGRRFGVEHLYQSVEQLLAESQVDVVAVCVPASAHLDASLPVLEAGKTLLVEKPLATTLEDCDALIATAAQQQSRAVVGFQLRFHELVARAKSVVESGALGEIEAVRSLWSSPIRRRREVPAWRDSRASGGGALFEIAGHHFDLWRYLLGSEIGELHAFSKGDQTPDGSVAVGGRMLGGTVVSGVFSERSGAANELQILGTDARLRFSLYRYDSFELTSSERDPGMTERLAEMMRKLSALPSGIAQLRRGGVFLSSYTAAWRRLIAAVGTDESTPHADLEDGRAAVAAVLAAIESESLGQSVRPR